ncbi:MAG: dTDP-3-amino-3,6-dideoxy-alpha-D-galactopyranose transaminase [Candidatus Accumulibacter appositus]|uniref:dTDP-3-amino-3,6-dideoxy-alpha-D-galactopyranose transaminase n=1 Tax=Candidatus Accumulibacter appositus TaxID=1454003 RepID=A0A011PNR8_9PROT|nr:lipopolysaccharide biosynthesis protein RfbH [Accumulibacter sp.]EXI78672.1 MAG: dTDP-3-amino-3,6-dideoxy-alpha-D-galactopyranose transaminase [Candidatus Accumulibacter appositus]HRF03332.1 lipopolysaccharide biosynthesis protein RfbH [Accumulibacter sp.]
MNADPLREQILDLVERHARETRPTSAFRAGASAVPVAGKVIGAGELRNMVDAVLDGWLTTGRFNTGFEQRLGRFLKVEHVLTTNSGSSANLLAFSALCSPSLGERAIKAGDEVITVAAGFPTTINPILQNGCVPVFVDVTLPTYNIDVAQIEKAISSRTRAIMLAHTLGNPFDLREVCRIAKKHDLWLIEDCCDALGSTYEGRSVGTFGDVGTLSFYPAHHITMGEGGAVFTHNAQLKRIMESLRDWGRDCYCATGCDNTCGKRFAQQHGDLPFGYDHKYTYSQLGYNLKITDIQAACALAQLDRLPDFIAARKRNFAWLTQRLAPLAEFLVLPEATPGSGPSWFGFPLTLNTAAGCDRVDLLRYLDEQRIGTRLLFAGNVTRQPYMRGRNFRVAGALSNTDRVMNDTFWIGLWSGLSEEMLDFVADRLGEFLGIGL